MSDDFNILPNDLSKLTTKQLEELADKIWTELWDRHYSDTGQDDAVGEIQ